MLCCQLLLHFPQCSILTPFSPIRDTKPLSSLFTLCLHFPCFCVTFHRQPKCCWFFLEIRHFLLQVGTPDPLPNWRQVPGFPVFGLGQPTEKGLTQVSGFKVLDLGCSQVCEALGRGKGQVESEVNSKAAANCNILEPRSVDFSSQLLLAAAFRPMLMCWCGRRGICSILDPGWVDSSWQHLFAAFKALFGQVFMTAKPPVCALYSILGSGSVDHSGHINRTFLGPCSIRWPNLKRPFSVTDFLILSWHQQ